MGKLTGRLWYQTHTAYGLCLLKCNQPLAHTVYAWTLGVSPDKSTDMTVQSMP